VGSFAAGLPGTRTCPYLSILLADEMFDVRRPVTVVANGKTVYEDVPRLDPAALLESILENIDPEQVFTYRIDLGAR
jgi:hypothetical protein